MSDLKDKLRYAASTADDWTKTRDKIQRKTIQDRLAQRKRRDKISKAKTASEKDKPAKQAVTRRNEKRFAAPPKSAPASCTKSPPENESEKRSVDDIPLDDFLELSALTEHRFLVLSEFSVQRAIVNNATMLAIDAAVLADYNGLSPWTTTNPFFAPSTSFPPSLSPTPLQLSTYHHPFLDLLAPAGLRDNILVAQLDDDQEDSLCHGIHEEGLRVWGGQPWSPVGWEFSQSFADQWGWLLDEGSIASSNFWRFERGEPPLKLPCTAPQIVEIA